MSIVNPPKVTCQFELVRIQANGWRSDLHARPISSIPAPDLLFGIDAI